jgi:hypothetical protein
MRPIIILIPILFLLSCNWRAKYRQLTKEPATTSRKDTPNWISILKSYEPKAYKGKVPKDFYYYDGFRDWWRFPLVYPYSIGCIDTKDYGYITSDKDKTDFRAGGGVTPLTDIFDKFTLDRNVFIGNRCNDGFGQDTTHYSESYFIFSFADGKQSTVAGRKNLARKLKELHFSGDTAFMTITQYSDRVWR